MKKMFAWIAAAILFSAYPVKAQKPEVNRSYFGLYGYYSIPLFQLAAKNYKWGPGIAVAYLSRRFPIDSQKYSLRLGVLAGISGQGNTTLHIPGTTSSTSGTQSFWNNYRSLNFLTRFTLEEKKRFKPYADLFIGSSTFSSQRDMNVNDTLSTQNDLAKKTVYSTALFNYGIGVGYIWRISEGFMMDARISFTQGHKIVSFIDLDKFSYDDNIHRFQPRERKAIPSLLTVQIGILFWVPKFTAVPSGYYHGENRSPSPGGPPRPTHREGSVDPGSRRESSSSPSPAPSHPPVRRH